MVVKLSVYDFFVPSSWDFFILLKLQKRARFDSDITLFNLGQNCLITLNKQGLGIPDLLLLTRVLNTLYSTQNLT